MDTELTPHFERHDNPAFNGSGYAYFDIELSAFYGDDDCDPLTLEVIEALDARGCDAPDLRYVVYGRLVNGVAEPIAHFDTLVAARRLLKNIGVRTLAWP